VTGGEVLISCLLSIWANGRTRWRTGGGGGGGGERGVRCGSRRER
jgi:hypothetical protein